MSILLELEQLPTHRILIYFCIAAGLLSPGILFLFVFCRDIFMHLDVLKLLVLSAGIGLPLLLFNVSAVLFLWEIKKRPHVANQPPPPDDLQGVICLACFIAIGIFTAVTATGYFLKWPASKAAGMIVLLHAGSSLGFYIKSVSRYRERMKAGASPA